jgi:hypothetical protein
MLGAPAARCPLKKQVGKLHEWMVTRELELKIFIRESEVSRWSIKNESIDRFLAQFHSIQVVDRTEFRTIYRPFDRPSKCRLFLWGDELEGLFPMRRIVLAVAEKQIRRDSCDRPGFFGD